MLEKVKGGYKVKREHGSGYFSKKPQSKAKAAAQLRAIEANKHRHAYDCGGGEDEDLDRNAYAEDCGCGGGEALDPTRKPYRLHRTAGGRMRIEYNREEIAESPLTTVSDARKHLQRHAQCACGEGPEG